MNVTWNIPARGYSVSGSPTTLGLPLQYGEGKTWDSLDHLAEYCRDNGVIAEVTPCEHTGGKWHHGSGGYRYLHEQTFRWPTGQY